MLINSIKSGSITITDAALFKTNNTITVKLYDHKLLGIGKGSPVLNYSYENIDDTETDLKKIVKLLKDRSFNNIKDIQTFIFTLQAKSIPSALFAIETALLTLLSKKTNTPIWKLLNKNSPHNIIKINALLNTDTDINDVAEFINKGVSSFKVKVGRTSIDKELQFLRLLRKTAGQQAEIRLDANKTISFADLKKRLDAYSTIAPSFIEEPCNTMLPCSYTAPFNIGADESIVQNKNRILKTESIYKIIILKPALHGIFNTLNIAKQAFKNDKQVTITHMMDGPVAINAALHTAFALSKPPLACGLYPHNKIDNWPDNLIFRNLYKGQINKSIL